MFKKFFLAKIGLLVFVVIFLMNWVKRFDGCYRMKICEGDFSAKDKKGSGYLEKKEKSLQSSGLQSAIQEGDETDDMDKRLISSVSLTQSEALHDISQDGKAPKDVFGLKKNEVKISDILTFLNTTRKKGNAKRQDSKDEIPSINVKERKETNDRNPLFKEDEKKLEDYGRKLIHFETEEDEIDDRERQSEDESKNRKRNDDDNDGKDDKVEDDITIYHPSRTTPDCPGNPDRFILRDLLSVWDKKARQSQIQYVLAYGSLLGYHRNGNVLPWDTDVDVFVGAQSYGQIRNIAVPRNFKYIKNDKTARLVIQTDVRFPSGNRTRVSCDGRIVERSIDGCTFQDPIARVVRGNRHLDIFEVYHLNSTFLYEPILKHSFHASELYPPKPCVFMGVEAYCPSNVPAVLRRKYGTDFNVPAKICVDGKWKDRTTVP